MLESLEAALRHIEALYTEVVAILKEYSRWIANIAGAVPPLRWLFPNVEHRPVGAYAFRFLTLLIAFLVMGIVVIMTSVFGLPEASPEAMLYGLILGLIVLVVSLVAIPNVNRASARVFLMGTAPFAAAIFAAAIMAIIGHFTGTTRTAISIAGFVWIIVTAVALAILALLVIPILVAFAIAARTGKLGGPVYDALRWYRTFAFYTILGVGAVTFFARFVPLGENPGMIPLLILAVIMLIMLAIRRGSGKAFVGWMKAISVIVLILGTASFFTPRIARSIEAQAKASEESAIRLRKEMVKPPCMPEPELEWVKKSEEFKLPIHAHCQTKVRIPDAWPRFHCWDEGGGELWYSSKSSRGTIKLVPERWPTLHDRLFYIHGREDTYHCERE